MNVNEIAMKTLKYIERTRSLNSVDKIVKETIDYIERTRNLTKGVNNYLELRKSL